VRAYLLVAGRGLFLPFCAWVACFSHNDPIVESLPASSPIRRVLAFRGHGQGPQRREPASSPGLVTNDGGAYTNSTPSAGQLFGDHRHMLDSKQR